MFTSRTAAERPAEMGNTFRPMTGVADANRPHQADKTDWKLRIRQFIVDHPQAGVGVALAAGVILGWLIKRR